MPTFQVFLARNYIVDVRAKNSQEAARCAEFFLSHGTNLSTEKDEKRLHFRIGQVEAVMNEAFEVHEVRENGL